MTQPSNHGLGKTPPPLPLPLLHEQEIAASPDGHKWVSASAGTGKTLVLVTRLIRLLIDGVRPDAILCLTFTKAGAAEMSNRLRTTLARWVRMDPVALRTELMAKGITCTPEVMALAPTLFVRLIDAAGMGLRIQTIHSFCQSLLEDFPMEANILPGFQAMDETQSAMVKQTILADIMDRAEHADATPDDRIFAESLQSMAHRMGEEAALKFVFKHAGEHEKLAALPQDVPAYLRICMDLPEGDGSAYRTAQCVIATIDDALQAIAAAAPVLGGKTGAKLSETIGLWMRSSPEARTEQIATLHSGFLTKQGKILKHFENKMPELLSEVETVAAWISELSQLEQRLALADFLSDSLLCVRHYAHAYYQHKQATGLVDYDDLIRRVFTLLKNSDIGPWIRFKMDSRIDHILVDEAQDTNETQWSIIKSLANEYFAGEGQKPDYLRTLFVVGDFKQAIFSFQGSSPLAFENASQHFEARALAIDAPFDRLDLGSNFRSTKAVLSAVDAVLAQMGSAQFGMDRPFTPHVANRNKVPGRVILWPLVRAIEEEVGDEIGEPDGGQSHGDDPDDAPNYIEKSAHILCENIASQIRHWIDHGIDGRAVVPGDVLILLRNRSDVAALLVAKLHDKSVEVEGVDRLLLKAPIVVQDLVAAARFAVQPMDDLNLAAVLTSPIIGWDQETLMQIGIAREKGIGLREAINRAAEHDAVCAATKLQLDSILGVADFVTPYRFFEHILIGPIGARERILARLGTESIDPMDALLNHALAFSQEEGANLNGFLDQYDRDTSMVKRESDGVARAVRVMTVHGSKGLESPIVILADTAIDPDNKKNDGFNWVLEDKNSIPLPAIGKADRFGAIADAYDTHISERLEENWRLMYVAMTRARDILCVAGSIKAPHKHYRDAVDDSDNAPPELAAPPNSWYRCIGESAHGAGWWTMPDDTGSWDSYGPIRAYGDHRLGTDTASKKQRGKINTETSLPRLPAWTHTAIGVEPRPPRPLSPSQIVIDQDGAAPALYDDTKQAKAQARGLAMHRLFELLPGIEPVQRREAGRIWIAKNYPEISEDTDSILTQINRVLDAPDFAAIFGPDALSEVPIAAVVGGVVISGQADRLLVTPETVLVVDFKTGLRVPASVNVAPIAHQRQMVAYIAALEIVFPGRRIDAALLYTSGPALLMLTPDIISRIKQDLFGANISLPLPS